MIATPNSNSLTTGLFTAVITPFMVNGDVDFGAFNNLIRSQVSAGVAGIVVCGSTGEAATLSKTEKIVLIEAAVNAADGRCHIIAGTGSNSTADTVETSKAAKSAGASALLLVTPYYNKPTPSGIRAHYLAVAEACDVPIILYNVPGRTAVNMSAELQLSLAECCPLIVGTKEASANLEQIAEIALNAPGGFTVIAGDDSLTLPTIAVGGRGVIAVIANYLPRTFGALVSDCLQGDFKSAAVIHRSLIPWYRANFLESNPIPVKYIMHKLGSCDLVYRLPLTDPQPATIKAIDELLSDTELAELRCR